MRRPSLVPSVFAIAFAASLALPLAACSSTVHGRGLGDTDGGVAANPEGGTSGAFVTNCFSYGDGCQCSYGSGTSTTACDPVSQPNSYCCADVGWPDRNLTCTCKTYTCKRLNGTTQDSCECGGYESGNLNSCTDAVCCSSTDTETCHCGPSITCNQFETQVDTCKPAYSACGSSSKIIVSSCSVR